MIKKKSTTLFIISLALLVLMGSTTLSMVYIVNTISKDAESINNAGIIRGSIQRLAKLESNGVPSDKLINDIEERVKDIRKILKRNIDKNIIQKELIEKLEKEWAILKNIIHKFRINPSFENKEALLTVSESLWKSTNDMVYDIQIISENKIKNFKILFPIMTANIFILIVLIYLIKNKVRDQLEKAVNKDPLTEVYNRHFFLESLRREVDRTERYNSVFVLIIFDIDHFKKVNDTFGHDVGDYVLKELSRLVDQSIRKSDILSRIGGEEFAIIAPNIDINSGATMAEKLREKVEKHRFDQVKHITVSFGVAQYERNDSLDDLYKKADIALYKAKNSGRNCVRLEK